MMPKKRCGFTLIEITVGMLLFSIILAAIFSALATANSSWNAGGSQINVQQEGRKALSAMSRELRQARLSTITGVPADGSNYNSITFQTPSSVSVSGTIWSTNIQYSLGGLNNTQLIRTQDGAQKVLANNISSISFGRTASNPDIINISISVQKNTFPGFSLIKSNLTLDSGVKLRN